MDTQTITLNTLQSLGGRGSFHAILSQSELEPDECKSALRALKADGLVCWVNNAYELEGRTPEPQPAEPVRADSPPIDLAIAPVQEDCEDSVLRAIASRSEPIADAWLEAHRLRALSDQESRPIVRDWLRELADKLSGGDA